jgi:uncharacterized protein YbcI
MPDDQATVEQGGALLAQLSNEIVKSKKRYFGKGPEAAKSYMFDDMLFVVMHGGVTTAEETLLQYGEEGMVRAFRQTFEDRMADQLTGLVEDLTGRKVVTYQSQIMFRPHRVVEMFVFDRPAEEAPRAATAQGQFSEGEVGAADATDALEAPAEPGRL